LKREAMYHISAALLVASLCVVQGQPGTIRVADYDVLRNTSSGPILCATDQPQHVLTDVRSRLHCLSTCQQNDQCSSFNFKDRYISSARSLSCEHFTDYPIKFTVDQTCHHYAVRARSLHFQWNNVTIM